MPRYDYECQQCGTVEELFRPMVEKCPPLCPHCTSTMRRLISRPNLSFPGPGVPWAGIPAEEDPKHPKWKGNQ